MYDWAVTFRQCARAELHSTIEAGFRERCLVKAGLFWSCFGILLFVPCSAAFTHARVLVVYAKILVGYARVLVMYANALVVYAQVLIVYAEALVVYAKALIECARVLVMYARVLVMYAQVLIGHAEAHQEALLAGGQAAAQL